MEDLVKWPEYQGEILDAVNEKLSTDALNRRALAWALRGSGTDSDHILRELAWRDAMLEVAMLSITMLSERIGREQTTSDAGFYLLKHIDIFAKQGKKFTEGRQPNTGGPIRKAIARELKKKPNIKNTALWDLLATKPPKGWQFFDNRLGKYAEGPNNDGMKYPRFCNVASEEREKIEK